MIHNKRFHLEQQVGPVIPKELLLKHTIKIQQREHGHQARHFRSPSATKC